MLKIRKDVFTIEFNVSSGLITFTVTGFFNERSSTVTSGPLRYFNRKFVVVRSANGVAIVNDILFVTVPSKEQLKVTKMFVAKVKGENSFAIEHRFAYSFEAYNLSFARRKKRKVC